MSADNVPIDIWRAQILIRLPAESLIQSRAVCKGWRAVIDDPPFARAHHQQQLIKKETNIIMIRRNSSTVCYYMDLKGLSFSSNGHQTIPATPLDLDALSFKFRRSRVSACNGLILTDKPLEIWNPSTHERLRLPPPGCFLQFSAFGLGYDYVTDDYKTVVITRENRRTHVYSLKSDSWRTIMNCPPGHAPFGPGVFVCGALNWLSIGEEGLFGDKIVSLDLGTEKYRLMQMQVPQTLGGGLSFHGTLLNLNVLEGCLIVCESGFSSHLDVWVMKDFGDEGSWTNLFFVESTEEGQDLSELLWGGFLRPVAFFRKEEDKRLQVFLQAEGDDCGLRLFVFDVETNSMKSVFIHGCDRDSCARQMFRGTIFRLHANCGGGARRKIAASGTNTKKASSSYADKELVFCTRDPAKWEDGDRDSDLSGDGSHVQSGTKLGDCNCSYNSSSSSEHDEEWLSYI